MFNNSVASSFTWPTICPGTVRASPLVLPVCSGWTLYHGLEPLAVFKNLGRSEYLYFNLNSETFFSIVYITASLNCNSTHKCQIRDCL